MTLLRCFVFAMAAILGPMSIVAFGAEFSGNWEMDLYKPGEHPKDDACGYAHFLLKQSHNKITGSHDLATARCARINDGGEKTVAGIVIGETAVLVVTSGRNGGIVLGKATRQGNKLHWMSLEEISPGTPEGDAFILEEGVLSLAANQRNSK